MKNSIKGKKDQALEEYSQLLGKAVFDPDDFEKKPVVKALLNFPKQVKSYYQEQARLWKKLFFNLKHYIFNFIEVIEQQNLLTNAEKKKLIQSLLFHLGGVYLAVTYPLSMGIGSSFFYIYYYHVRKIVKLINQLHQKIMRFFYHQRSLVADKKRALEPLNKQDIIYAQVKEFIKQLEINLDQIEKILDLALEMMRIEKIVDDLNQLADTVYEPLNKYLLAQQEELLNNLQKEIPSLLNDSIKFKSFEESRFDSLESFKKWGQQIELIRQKSNKLKLTIAPIITGLQDLLATIFEEKKSGAFDSSQIKSRYFADEESVEKNFPIGSLDSKAPICRAKAVERVVSIIEEEQKSIHEEKDLLEIEEQSERLKSLFFQDDVDSSSEGFFNEKLINPKLINSLRQSFMSVHTRPRSLIFSQTQRISSLGDIGLRA